MILQVKDDIQLELIDTHHADKLYQLIVSNQAHLQPWLPWVAYVHNDGFINQFIASTLQRQAQHMEYAFVIANQQNLVGRIGIYKIDHQNKTGEIGYWISKNYEGKGIVTTCCKALVNFAFKNLQLNRI